MFSEVLHLQPHVSFFALIFIVFILSLWELFVGVIGAHNEKKTRL